MGMPQNDYVHRFFACADPRRLLDGIGDGLDLRRGVALANNKVMTDCVSRLISLLVPLKNEVLLM